MICSDDGVHPLEGSHVDVKMNAGSLIHVLCGSNEGMCVEFGSKYSETRLRRFSRDQRKETYYPGKRIIREPKKKIIV